MRFSSYVTEEWMLTGGEIPSIPAGRRSRLTRGNGVTTDFAYDAGSRPTLISHKKPDGTVLSSFAYTFDQAGRIRGTQYVTIDHVGQAWYDDDMPRIGGDEVSVEFGGHNT